MMFSATYTQEARERCQRFMSKCFEVTINDESKLTLHGLLQYYVKLPEKEKARKLNDLLDSLEFNQVVIFTKTVQRAEGLNRLLDSCSFPSIAIHSSMTQEMRIK